MSSGATSWAKVLREFSCIYQCELNESSSTLKCEHSLFLPVGHEQPPRRLSTGIQQLLCPVLFLLTSKIFFLKNYLRSSHLNIYGLFWTFRPG